MSDGIEIHFDAKRGYLALGCEPDAFAPYRAIARDQLEDFPEIPVDKIIEINLVDTATFVARRDAPKKRFGDLIPCTVIVVVLSLAAVGAVTLYGKLFG
jgi:hypothetical protein